MGKLKLKRTSEEQAAHELHKAQKRARKAEKRRRPTAGSLSDEDDRPPTKRRADGLNVGQDYVFDEDEFLAEESYRSHKPDYDYIQAQVEEERFREKLWGALGDDERMDTVEASMNAYAHIPRRWRGGGMDKMDDEIDVDPQMMEDEDYAEWMRAAMWRKKHAAEHAEQEQQKAERAARLERERKLKEETAKLEKVESERRRQRRNEAERRRWADARAQYETRWTLLLGGVDASQPLDDELTFGSIPWPVLITEVGPTLDAKGKGKSKAALELEDLTSEAISSFLLPGGKPAESLTIDKEVIKKERRDKLRETMLRFHPDKFEGRIMHRVRASDKVIVRDAVGRVARAINGLLAGKDH
ncbi:hypothetical protein BC835DRAFT_228963 [Cytidiella melzeri]|nr:hypothetical protein BC835DRAFT_228963 [Cytidiella melzeri]